MSNPDYTVVRKSNRRHIKIQVTPDAEILVHAPRFCPNRAIDTVVQNHHEWIKKQLSKAEKDVIKIKSGTQIPFLGENMLLVFHTGSAKQKSISPLVRLGDCDGTIIVQVFGSKSVEEQQSEIQNALIEWYKNKGALLLPQRLSFYVRKLGLKSGKVRIKWLKSRWGSCTTKGAISLNAKLMMAPVNVIDYVIVHELCHLKHMNHSMAFWNAVEEIMPDFRKYRRLLAQFQRIQFATC